jgi:hypothetical protein
LARVSTVEQPQPPADWGVQSTLFALSPFAVPASGLTRPPLLLLLLELEPPLLLPPLLVPPLLVPPLLLLLPLLLPLLPAPASSPAPLLLPAPASSLAPPLLLLPLLPLVSAKSFVPFGVPTPDGPSHPGPAVHITVFVHPPLAFVPLVMSLKAEMFS